MKNGIVRSVFQCDARCFSVKIVTIVLRDMIPTVVIRTTVSIVLTGACAGAASQVPATVVTT